MGDLQFDFDAAETCTLEVDDEQAGVRLDQFLAVALNDFSRAGVQRLIKLGAVILNGTAATRASVKVQEGDQVAVTVPALKEPSVTPQSIELTVLHEDDDVLVIDKAPGMAVHPGAGRPDGTVANAVAARIGIVGPRDRPGIVHRLDLATSGVMAIAKHESAHASLSAAFKERAVVKVYLAITHGVLDYDEYAIDAPLGRSLRDPKKMAVRHDQGRASFTGVAVNERFERASFIECRPRTGRTHQIRVHLLSTGHPLLGDATYARGRANPVSVPRLMLHASSLTFPHPRTNEPVTVEAPVPADMSAVLALLRAS